MFRYWEPSSEGWTPRRLSDTSWMAITPRWGSQAKIRPPYYNAARAKRSSQYILYNMKRDVVELSYNAAQWTHRAVWNRWYMEPKRGHHMGQMWADHETDMAQKVTVQQKSRSTTRVVQQLPRPANQPLSCLRVNFSL